MFSRMLLARPLGVAACVVSLLIARAAQAADAIVPPHVRSQTAPDWPANVPADHDVDVIVVVTVAADGAVLDAHVDDSAGADYDQAPRSMRSALAIRARDAQWSADPRRACARWFTSHPRPWRRAPASRQTLRLCPCPKRAGAESRPGRARQRLQRRLLRIRTVQPKSRSAGRARPPTRGASDYSISIGELSIVPRKKRQ